MSLLVSLLSSDRQDGSTEGSRGPKMCVSLDLFNLKFRKDKLLVIFIWLLLPNLFNPVLLRYT